jgi:hypothetical protein
MSEEPTSFQYLDSINEKKDDLMTDMNEFKYNAYLINHFLSGTIDSLFQANEMNCKPFLDKRLQYDYLRTSIRNGRRRSKWLKKEQVEDLKLIQQFFKCNNIRAKEALDILTGDQIEEIKRLMDPGGTK